MFKTASTAIAAVLASATLASADINYISTFAETQDNDNRVELGLVRAASDGVVELYQYSSDELGALLGTEMVQGGANTNVNFVIPRQTTDLIAVLKVDGQIVDTQEIDF